MPQHLWLQQGCSSLLHATKRAVRCAVGAPVASLPVAALDVLAAQSLLYALTKGLGGQLHVIEAWLETLQLAQLASDRLLQALAVTQRHLRFWRQRLQAGSHGSFLLWSRGPAALAADVAARLGWGARQEQQAGLAASDRIEERIAALELLFMQLAEALAEVHTSADLLRLLHATATASGQPHQHQQQLTPEAVLRAVSSCLQRQAASLQALLAEADQLQEQDAAARQLRAVPLARAPGSTSLQRSSSRRPGRYEDAAATGAATQGGSSALRATQEQLQALRQLLGVQPGQLARKHSDAGAALAAASRLAAELGPLLPVPGWAAMPSSFERHWIRYTLAAGAATYACVFLVRNSRLCGSTNLDDWAAGAAEVVRGGWRDHIVEPLLTVRDELFSTFRDRPSIVSTAEFEADKASLLRMLADFTREHPDAVAAAVAATLAAASSSSDGSSSGGGSSSDGSSDGGSSTGVGQLDVMDIDAVNRGMQAVLHSYEADLKKPIRGLLAGELARTLLIQVQRLKLDTEAAMLELDQILRANELSISLVAAVPALVLSWTLLRGAWTLLLVRPPPDPRRDATPCRLAMAELERALAALAALGGANNQQQSQEQEQQRAAAKGRVLFKLFVVHCEAQAVYRLKDASSKFSDWPSLSADLVALADPSLPPAARLELHHRMLRTYTVLQP